MKLNGNLVLRAGIAWAVIGVILMILAPIFGSSFGVEGLSLWGYAAMFAGVHYAIRSGKEWLEAVIGGALAGLLAGVIIVLVQMLLGGTLPIQASGGFNLTGLLGAFIAGLAGGLGTRLSQKF
ncbi:MAG: hypothetical protein JXJ17_10950 [Anaerolineae bacterium]|nr:hypothetical protein [Anaerolineae bacterium]